MLGQFGPVGLVLLLAQFAVIGGLVWLARRTWAEQLRSSAAQEEQTRRLAELRGELERQSEAIAARDRELAGLRDRAAGLQRELDATREQMLRQRLGGERGREPLARYERMPSEDVHDTVEIAFGTNRVGEKINNRVRFNSSERGTLTVGVASVTIPRDHQRGRIERPWILQIAGQVIAQQAEDPREHMTIASCRLLELSEFGTLVNDKTREDSFVFIHGYNVAFDDALYRTAQLACDLGIEGMPMMFSWPSKGQARDYVHDLKTARASVEALVDFLFLTWHCTRAPRVNIIAHSMGNVVLTEALQT